jgi:2-iminobutanoate/2-iminopropanoate deaminase
MKHSIIGGEFKLADGTKLPLSKAVRAGDFVFLSGQLGLKKDGALADGIAQQTLCCLKNIEELLSSASLTKKNVIKTTVWLTDVTHFAEFNAIYAETFDSAPPARSTVCSALALPKALVEIEVVAYG